MRPDDDDSDRRPDLQAILRADVPVPPSLEGRARDLASRIAGAEERAGGGEPALAAGSLLGAYEVLARIGEGGQGRVYQVRHRHLGRLAAAKVPWRAVAARVLSEARLAERVKGERIVAVLDVAPEGDPPHLVLEWCPGGSLAERIAKAGGVGLPLEEARAVAADVLRGLALAHRSGVVHCDVKPANVLFGEDGRAKLGDLGIGRVPVEEAARLSNTAAQTGAGASVALAGTPLYVAPEQERPALLEGRPLDGRADLFALGKVLFEMLTGASPRTVRPPSRLRKGLDPRWDDLVFRLVEERPAARFASAEEALAALEALPGEPGAAAPVAASHAGAVEARPIDRLAEASHEVADGAERTLRAEVRREGLRYLVGVALAGAAGVGSFAWIAEWLCRVSSGGIRVRPFETDFLLGAGAVIAVLAVLDALFSWALSIRRPRPLAAGLLAGGAGVLVGFGVLFVQRPAALTGDGVTLYLRSGPPAFRAYPDQALLAGALLWLTLLVFGAVRSSRGRDRGDHRFAWPGREAKRQVVKARAVEVAEVEEPSDSARLERPSLAARIAAIVGGVLAIGGAVVGAGALASLVFLLLIIEAIGRGCSGSSHSEIARDPQITIWGIVILLAAGAGIAGVVWGIVGLVVRGVRGRRERRKRAAKEGATE